MSGWQLLDPRWLWALGALALPVVLHLISRGTARIVAMGSIRFLRHHKSRRAQRLRPTQLLLLLLRCLLLAALALLLAGPVRSVRDDKDDAARALVSADVWRDHVAGRLDDATSAQLDTVDQAGRLVHMTPATDAREPADRRSEDVWSHLRAAARTVPAGARLQVVAYDRMDHLAGARPSVPVDVDWIVPSVTPSSTATTGGFTEATNGTADGLAEVPLTIVLRHADNRVDDARYVVAVLNALAETGPLALTVDAAPAPSDAAPIDAVPDDAAPDRAVVLVWLGDGPPPATWEAAVARGASLLHDGAGPWMDCDVAVLADVQTVHAVRLKRCGDAGTRSPADETARPVPVWRTAHGDPVLSVAATVAGGRTWQLASRFHPDWSTLVLSPGFPRWWATWLTGEAVQQGLIAPQAPRIDRRPAGAQRFPHRLTASTMEGSRTVPSVPSVPSVLAAERLPERAAGDVSPWFWLLVALLVVLERVVALRTRG